MKKYLNSILLIIVLTFLSLYYILKDNYMEVILILKEIPMFLLICIFSFSFLYYFFVAYSLYVITKTKVSSYTFKEALMNAYVGGFFSGITPSSSGGQVGQIYVYHHQNVSVSNASSFLWLDFVMYQITMIIYTSILVVFKFSTFYKKSKLLLGMVFSGYIVNGIVLLGLIIIIVFPMQIRRLVFIIIQILLKAHIFKNKDNLMDKYDKMISEFRLNIQTYKKDKWLLIKLFFINCLRLSVYYSIPYLISEILNIPLDFMNSLALSSYVSMANAFFPVPGASGGTEIMFQQLYSLILDSNYVSIILILWRFVTFHLSILIGCGIFIKIKMKKE